jgi:hypothetical protein
MEDTPLKSEADESGVIFVASRVTQPAKLTEGEFVKWYEDIHVPEVLATGGVPGAVRWVRVSSATADEEEEERNGFARFPFLTLYAFPSMQFRFTRAFRGLDGQTSPKGDLLERVFSRAEFATRFCALVWDAVGDSEVPVPSGAVAVVSVTGGLSAEEIGGRVKSAMEGIGRVQVYDTRDSTVLCEFVRRHGWSGFMIFVWLQDVEGSDRILELTRDAVKPAVAEEWAVFKSGLRYADWT